MTRKLVFNCCYHNLGLQNCMNKTSGTMSFGQKRAKQRCLAVTHSENQRQTISPNTSFQLPSMVVER